MESEQTVKGRTEEQPWLFGEFLTGRRELHRFREGKSLRPWGRDCQDLIATFPAIILQDRLSTTSFPGQPDRGTPRRWLMPLVDIDAGDQVGC